MPDTTDRPAHDLVARELVAAVLDDLRFPACDSGRYESAARWLAALPATEYLPATTEIAAIAATAVLLLAAHTDTTPELALEQVMETRDQGARS